MIWRAPSLCIGGAFATTARSKAQTGQGSTHDAALRRPGGFLQLHPALLLHHDFGHAQTDGGRRQRKPRRRLQACAHTPRRFQRQHLAQPARAGVARTDLRATVQQPALQTQAQAVGKFVARRGEEIKHNLMTRASAGRRYACTHKPVGQRDAIGVLAHGSQSGQTDGELEWTIGTSVEARDTVEPEHTHAARQAQRLAKKLQLTGRRVQGPAQLTTGPGAAAQLMSERGKMRRIERQVQDIASCPPCALGAEGVAGELQGKLQRGQAFAL